MLIRDTVIPDERDEIFSDYTLFFLISILSSFRTFGITFFCVKKYNILLDKKMGGAILLLSGEMWVTFPAAAELYK